MSTTIEAIDFRSSLTGWLKGITSMTCADINAIPDDKWTATWGGCTRPANVLAADALSTVEWATEALKGNAISVKEDRTAKIAGEITTKAAAIERVTRATENLASAISAASDETLNKVVAAPWGADAPLYLIAQIAVSHIWYHDGQFNYIHCLLGDDKIYWGG